MDFQVRSAFPRVFVVPAAVYDERVLGISDLRGGGEGGGVAVEERGRVESVRSYSRAESVLAVSGLGEILLTRTRTCKRTLRHVHVHRHRTRLYR